MDEHSHGPDGSIIYHETETAPEPAAEQAQAVEAAADASVDVAKVQGRTEIAIAKESTEQTKVLADTELAELRAENRTLREVLDRFGPQAAAEPEPEAEQVPVMVEPEPEAVAPAPEPEPAPPDEPKKSRLSYWP